MATGDSTPRQDPSADIGSEALPSLAFCDTHKDQEIERYCETHKCLVCAKCIIFKHNQCRPVTLTDKIGTFDPHIAVNDDIKTVTALLQRVQLLQACNESDRNALTASVKKCRDDVDKLKEKINRQLDEARHTLDSVLQAHELRLNTGIDKHVTNCKHVIDVLEAQLKQLKTCQILDKSTMYIGHTKAQADIEETGQAVRKLKTDLEQNRLLKYEPGEDIERCLKELHTLGEIVEQRVNGVRKCVSVDKCIDIDVKPGRIGGCTFLPDGTIVFCDDSIDRLFHCTDTFQYRSTLILPSFPWAVTAIADQEVVVVTQHYDQKLQFVTTAGGLKLGRTITLDRECYGIEHRNGKLYVTCHDKDGGRGEVVVLDMSGKVLTRIGRIDRRLLGPKYMFEKPGYVCASTDGSRIYVSDYGTDTVTCLSEEGQIIYQSKEIDRPRGMCLGPGDQLAVCWWGTEKMVLLGDRGQALSELVTWGDGVKCPRCVTYRPRDGVLVVGMWGVGLKAFWLK